MPIQIVMGDDSYAIAQHLKSLRQSIGFPELNYRMVEPAKANELTAALADANAMPLGGSNRLVIIRLQFDSFAKEDQSKFDAIITALSVPDTTLLVFVARALDRRLGWVKKLFAMVGKKSVFEFDRPSEWRPDLIAAAIAKQAKQIGQALTNEQLDYLATAVGNDTLRSASEIAKLLSYSNGQPLSDREVMELVASETQNSLQLADAVRRGDAARALYLLNSLDAMNADMRKVVSTLTTQFRTWTFTKALLEQNDRTRQTGNPTLSDYQIANTVGFGNPKRVYYLRQEVADHTSDQLAVAYFNASRLMSAIFTGRRSRITPVVIALSNYFADQAAA